MRMHMDNLPEKDSSGSSGADVTRTTGQGSGSPTPEDDLLTPRDQLTGGRGDGFHRPDSLALPCDLSDNVSKWVTTRGDSRGHRSSVSHQQSTPKSTSSKSVTMHDKATPQSGKSGTTPDSGHWGNWNQGSPHQQLATPTPDTPGYGTKPSAPAELYFKSHPADNFELNSSRSLLGVDSTSTPALNVLPSSAEDFEPLPPHSDDNFYSAPSSATRNDEGAWFGSTESLSAIDFSSKEIRVKTSKAAYQIPSNYKYTSLRDRLSGNNTNIPPSQVSAQGTHVHAPMPPHSSGVKPKDPRSYPREMLGHKPLGKSSAFHPFIPDSGTASASIPHSKSMPFSSLHRPTPLKTRETQAPSPVHFKSFPHQN